MLDLVGEVLFQELIQVRLDLLPGAGLYPLEVEFSAFFAVEHAALHEFETQLVVLEAGLFAVGLLVAADEFLLNIVFLDCFADEILI